jgi:rod shape-determining protein MreD
MWLKLLLITLVFFLVACVQNSFLPHTTIMGVAPNIIFILFFVLVFFEKKDAYYRGFFLAIIAGFISDLFLSSYFGASIISFLATYLAIKTMLYFLKERQEKYLLVYSIPMFLLCLAIYNSLLYALVHFPYIKVTVDKNILIELLYNTVVALVVFFLAKTIYYKKPKDRQLTLFR